MCKKVYKCRYDGDNHIQNFHLDRYFEYSYSLNCFQAMRKVISR